MEIRVNPTRMELNRLKRQVVTAERGHKLLKDKRDELTQQFLTLIRRNKELREEIEQELSTAFARFMLARAVMSPETLEAALMYPAKRLSFTMKRHNIMGVSVPRLTQEGKETAPTDQSGIYPYGFLETPADLDRAIEALLKIMPKLLELAEIEKATQLLAVEIEKTRRRVNALEHVFIPEIKDTIRYISMKLDENERGALTRLMKVKDMVRAKV